MGVYPRRELPGRGAPVWYVVRADASASTIAADLGRVGVIDRPFFFAAYLRLSGAMGSLRDGRTVILPFGTTPEQLVRRLAVGLGAVVARVTIPEGYDGPDIARRLEANQLGRAEDFLRVMHDPAVAARLRIPGDSLEGYLFPDTYELRDDESPEAILTHLVENFRARTAPLFASHAAGLGVLRSELGFGPHEVVVLASVVEKEAAVADERATIAGVFLNRLRSTTFLPRQRLQSDPTVSYGCRVEAARAPSCADFTTHITRAMLDDSANRFNTYRHAGLPPTAIANPGLAAIEAVLAPEQHGYFYFVARGGRRHAFSETLGDHNAAVGDARDRGAIP